MADKPKDNKPATEFGEVKVIKNDRDPTAEPPTAPQKGAGEPTSPAPGPGSQGVAPMTPAKPEG